MDVTDPVYKRIKFEVFEKDSFKCQVCGAVAPNVNLTLHRLQNNQQAENWLDPAFLTTFCESCQRKNSSQESANTVNNGHLSLNALEERLEQLKMLINWRKGMIKIRKRQLASLVEFWQELVPSIFLSEVHKKTLLSCISKYSSEDIKEAMRLAVQEFIVVHQDGSIARDSFQMAFANIPEICYRKTKVRKTREAEELYHIHDILEERIDGFFDSARVIQWLHYARSWDVHLEELIQMAARVTNWTQFSCSIDELVHRQKYFLGRGRPDSL